MRKSSIAVLIAVVLGNLGVWAFYNHPVEERAWLGLMNGVAFTPFQAHQSPIDRDRPTLDDIRGDFRVLDGHIKSVRTYSTTDGSELVPVVAEEYGIDTTVGAWLQGKPEIDEPEIEGLIRIANAQRNVHRLLVGNEAILRADITVEQAIENIRRVKARTRVPVSTAEPWHVWLAHPELVAAADYIAVHILPYWEGVPVDEAVAYSMYRYNELRHAYPNKPILIGEVGWPSNGPWRRGAEASQVNQARFIRQFLNLAETESLDYYIMEAFDQPWKRTIEGSAGTAWGIWDTNRNAKFPMVGDVLEVPDWPVLYGIATLMALVPMVFFLYRRRDLRPAGLFFYAALIQAVASVLVWTVIAAMTSGLAVTTEIAWGVLIFAQLVLLGMLLTDGLEIAEVVWTNQYRRRFEPASADPPANAPKVSIHVPCYNEPPHMVIQTLNALSRLNYPNFEVLVIDNNTKDEAVWRPLEAYCQQLGARFRFFHLPKWPGYKAGALNFALTETAADAEVVAVIDSDYQVTPDWLSRTVPFFEKPEVGFVQSPQDYREWEGDAFKTMINWEYAGFFHIGMIRRNEYNAIIQHGTMTLIRKTALQQGGGWAEWCITEDAELGLRLFQEGFEAVYMPNSYGKGLVPDSFSGYKTQRHRWAYGAVQILKRHWRELLPGGQRLSGDQKYQFVSGWMSWFADAAHMVFATAGVAWSLGLLLFPKYFEFPPNVFLLPTLCVFVFKIAASFWLYEHRVRCSFVEKIGAAVAGMALTHTVGRAVWQGLFTSGRPFVRTPKCENQPRVVQALAMAREEVGLMLGLWSAATAIILVFGHENRDAFMWAGLLLVQSLPYLSALVTALINVLPEIRYLRRSPVGVIRAAD